MFFANHCVFANLAEDHFWQARRAAVDQVRPLSPSFRLPKPNPSQFGRIKKISSKKSAIADISIFHIQDIHQNFEAQNNISKAIHSLIDQNQVDLVLLEGGFSDYDFSPFRKNLNHAVREKVSNYLLKKNSISGPVFAALTNENKIPQFVGIDDEKSYRANVEAYRAASKILSSQKQVFDQLLKDSLKVESGRMNPSLLNFHMLVRRRQSGEIKLGEYASQLLSIKDQLFHTLSLPISHHSILKLAEAFKIEKTLDLGAVEKERQIVLSSLVKKMNSQETSLFAKKTMSYRMGDISSSDFYNTVLGLCESHQYALRSDSTLVQYAHYLQLSNSIDSEKLSEEIRDLENVCYQKLISTKEEQSLVVKSQVLALIGKLLDFSLSSKEWNQYRSLMDARTVNFSQDELRKFNLTPFENFYSQAQIRDRKMAENILREISRHQAKRVVVVTGGFHSEGIGSAVRSAKDLVRSNKSPRHAPHTTRYELSFFTPNISKIDTVSGSAYLTSFAQKKSSLEQLFNQEKLFLSPEVFTNADKVHFISLSALFDLAGAKKILVDLSGDLKASIETVTSKSQILVNLKLVALKLKAQLKGQLSADGENIEGDEFSLSPLSQVTVAATAFFVVNYLKSFFDFHHEDSFITPLLAMAGAYKYRKTVKTFIPFRFNLRNKTEILLGYDSQNLTWSEQPIELPRDNNRASLEKMAEILYGTKIDSYALQEVRLLRVETKDGYRETVAISFYFESSKEGQTIRNYCVVKLKSRILGEQIKFKNYLDIVRELVQQPDDEPTGLNKIIVKGRMISFPVDIVEDQQEDRTLVYIGPLIPDNIMNSLQFLYPEVRIKVDFRPDSPETMTALVGSPDRHEPWSVSHTMFQDLTEFQLVKLKSMFSPASDYSQPEYGLALVDGVPVMITRILGLERNGPLHIEFVSTYALSQLKFLMLKEALSEYFDRAVEFNETEKNIFKEFSLDDINAGVGVFSMRVRALQELTPPSLGFWNLLLGPVSVGFWILLSKIELTPTHSLFLLFSWIFSVAAHELAHWASVGFSPQSTPQFKNGNIIVPHSKAWPGFVTSLFMAVSAGIISLFSSDWFMYSYPVMVINLIHLFSINDLENFPQEFSELKEKFFKKPSEDSKVNIAALGDALLGLLKSASKGNGGTISFKDLLGPIVKENVGDLFQDNQDVPKITPQDLNSLVDYIGSKLDQFTHLSPELTHKFIQNLSDVLGADINVGQKTIILGGRSTDLARANSLLKKYSNSKLVILCAKEDLVRYSALRNAYPSREIEIRVSEMNLSGIRQSLLSLRNENQIQFKNSLLTFSKEFIESNQLDQVGQDSLFDDLDFKPLEELIFSLGEIRAFPLSIYLKLFNQIAVNA